MSRTVKGSKGPLFEYWSKRKFNKGGSLYSAGRKTKKFSIRAERAVAKREIRSLI